MKFRFGTRDLLLSVAFAAVFVAGSLPLWRELLLGPGMLAALGLMSPVLVPCLFVGYIAGRRALTPKLVVVFAIAEAASAGAFALLRP